jgi:hypothetical protein
LIQNLEDKDINEKERFKPIVTSPIGDSSRQSSDGARNMKINSVRSYIKDNNMSNNTFNSNATKYNSFCYFFNSSTHGCRKPVNVCPFKHEKAPFCKWGKDCHRINSKKICQFFHPQSHFIEIRRQSLNPPRTNHQQNPTLQRFHHPQHFLPHVRQTQPDVQQEPRRLRQPHDFPHQVHQPHDFPHHVQQAHDFPHHVQQAHDYPHHVQEPQSHAKLPPSRFSSYIK